MVRTEKRPVENMMTLGGVATGSMNAQEALNAAGIMKSFGSVAAPMAAAARIGISNVVVAVLLVTSVRKVTDRQIIPIISMSGSVDSCSRLAPMVPLRPEFMNAVAMAMPAPKRINMPHGILFAVSQSKSFSPSPLGMRNSATTPKNATMASLL